MGFNLKGGAGIFILVVRAVFIPTSSLSEESRVVGRVTLFGYRLGSPAYMHMV